MEFLVLYLDVPGAPRNLQPTEVSKSSVTLTWEVPEQDGGSPVTGYVVERRQTTATRWTKAHKQTVTDTTFTATDLLEMAEYEFRVAAENVTGIGKPCQPVGPILTKSPFGVYLLSTVQMNLTHKDISCALRLVFCYHRSIYLCNVIILRLVHWLFCRCPGLSRKTRHCRGNKGHRHPHLDSTGKRRWKSHH